MLGHIRNPTQHMVSFLGISIYILYGSGIAIFGLVKTTFGHDFSTTNTKQKQLSSDTFLYKNRIQGSDEMRPLRSEDPADLPQQDPRHPDQGEWQEEARLLRVPEEVPEEGGLVEAALLTFSFDNLYKKPNNTTLSSFGFRGVRPRSAESRRIFKGKGSRTLMPP